MQGGGAAWNGSAHGVYFFSSLDCTVEGLRNIRMWHTKQTDTLYVLLYLKWITNKDLLYSKGSLLNVMWQPAGEGVLGRMDTCVCLAESLLCSPETITTLLIAYTPIQN